MVETVAAATGRWRAVRAIIQRAIAKVMPAAARSGLFVSLATFQSSDANDFPDGWPSGDYQDLPGLVDLPCMLAPEDLSYIAATEDKAAQTITSRSLFHVTFTTIYPSIVDGWHTGWRVVVDGVAYDLVGAGADSQGQHSVVKGRLVSI